MNWMIGSRKSDVAILVVILAFMFYVFFAFPPFAGSERPTGAACLSNLKQIALAQAMYAEEHDGLLPDATAWMDEIIPYVKNQGIYHCPALRKTPEAYGYAMDFAVSEVNTRKMGAPESTPLAFESVLLVRNATSGFYGFPEPPRHGRRNGLAFVDGHSKWLTPEQATSSGSPEREKR